MAKFFLLIFALNSFGSFLAAQIVPQDALLFLADIAFELLDGQSKEAAQLKGAIFLAQKGCDSQLNPEYVQKFGTEMQKAMNEEFTNMQKSNGTNGQMPCPLDDKMQYTFIYNFGQKLLTELMAKGGQKLGPTVEYSALKSALNSRTNQQQIISNNQTNKKATNNEINIEAYSPVAKSAEESENWVELMKIIAKKEKSGEDLKWAEFSKAKNDTFSKFKDVRVQSSIFEGNKQNIRAHNEAYARKEVSYKLGLNHFADYCIQLLWSTNCHSRSRYIRDYDSGPLLENAYNGASKNRQNQMKNALKTRRKREAGFNGGQQNGTSLPNSMDWRDMNGTKFVTDIVDKNKIMDALYGEAMHCSKTSFAFVAASTLETHIMKRTGKLHRFSAKQFMDCVPADQYNVNIYGKCTGGYPASCYSYMMDKNFGVEDWNSYEMQIDSTCLYNASNSVANIVDWDVITMDPGSNYVNLSGEDGLKYIIAKMGPVSTSIVYHEKLFLYRGGIYYDRFCNGAAGAIYVTIVGYGTDEQTGMDYWLIKNHWGKDWGENGYMRLARNQGNNCLVAGYASFPLFANWQDAYAEIGIQV